MWVKNEADPDCTPIVWMSDAEERSTLLGSESYTAEGFEIPYEVLTKGNNIQEEDEPEGLGFRNLPPSPPRKIRSILRVKSELDLKKELPPEEESPAYKALKKTVSWTDLKGKGTLVEIKHIPGTAAVDGRTSIDSSYSRKRKARIEKDQDRVIMIFCGIFLCLSVLLAAAVALFVLVLSGSDPLST
jgi:hypothetical protein